MDIRVAIQLKSACPLDGLKKAVPRTFWRPCRSVQLPTGNVDFGILCPSREAHDAARGDSPDNGQVAQPRESSAGWKLQGTAAIIQLEPEKSNPE